MNAVLSLVIEEIVRICNALLQESPKARIVDKRLVLPHYDVISNAGVLLSERPIQHG